MSTIFTKFDDLDKRLEKLEDEVSVLAKSMEKANKWNAELELRLESVEQANLATLVMLAHGAGQFLSRISMADGGPPNE